MSFPSWVDPDLRRSLENNLLTTSMDVFPPTTAVAQRNSMQEQKQQPSASAIQLQQSNAIDDMQRQKQEVEIKNSYSDMLQQLIEEVRKYHPHSTHTASSNTSSASASLASTSNLDGDGASVPASLSSSLNVAQRNHHASSSSLTSSLRRARDRSTSAERDPSLSSSKKRSAFPAHVEGSQYCLSLGVHHHEPWHYGLGARNPTGETWQEREKRKKREKEEKDRRAREEKKRRPPPEWFDHIERRLSALAQLLSTPSFLNTTSTSFPASTTSASAPSAAASAPSGQDNTFTPSSSSSSSSRELQLLAEISAREQEYRQNMELNRIKYQLLIERMQETTAINKKMFEEEKMKLLAFEQTLQQRERALEEKLRQAQAAAEIQKQQQQQQWQAEQAKLASQWQTEKESLLEELARSKLLQEREKATLDKLDALEKSHHSEKKLFYDMKMSLENQVLEFKHQMHETVREKKNMLDTLARVQQELEIAQRNVLTLTEENVRLRKREEDNQERLKSVSQLEDTIRQLRVDATRSQDEVQRLTARMREEEEAATYMTKQLQARLEQVELHEQQRRTRAQLEHREYALRFQPREQVTYDQDYVDCAWASGPLDRSLINTQFSSNSRG